MITEEKIAVMQAYLDGKNIERRRVDGSIGWHVVETPLWNWEACDYRIYDFQREKKRYALKEYLQKGTSLQIDKIEDDGDACKVFLKKTDIALNEIEKFNKSIKYKVTNIAADGCQLRLKIEIQ